MTEAVYSRIYEAGEMIFQRGEQGSHAYFIEHGSVDVMFEKEQSSVAIARLGAGEIIGEMSMIDDAPRSATVVAREQTECIVIERSRFIEPMTSADPLMKLILRVLLKRLRQAQERYTETTDQPDEADGTLEEIRHLAFRRINDERNLKHGFRNNAFEIHYQPVINIQSGHIAGFEALMRWRKENGELGLPGSFIPLAEQCGMISELGRFALETSLGNHRVILENFAAQFPNHPAPFISTNVSGLQLSDSGELDAIGEIIQTSGIDPDLVTLEITETSMVQHPEQAARAMKKLKTIGVSFAIDDFGKGHSGLSYLHTLPFDVLKIDRDFVTGMKQTENGLRIIKSIIGLGLALDMTIVAEGIEEPTQPRILQDLGCHYGQGILFSSPQPKAEILELLRSAKTWTC